MDNNYHKKKDILNTTRLRTLLKDLPDFSGEFFRGISVTTSSSTRLVYSYDLRIFFRYLIKNANHFENKSLKDITLNDLENITPEDIESYLEYLTYYTTTNKTGKINHHKNELRGKSRKLASIKTMYRYFVKKRRIKNDPSKVVDMPKIHEKNIVMLEKHEIINLLNNIESGEFLTEKEKQFHAYNKNRDIAIVTLLLGTGLRVSELVGINIEHVDFNVNGIKITRKGGNEVVIYFGDEVDKKLKIYIKERKEIITIKGYENALFLSLQKRRITVRAVQKLVKKYSISLNSFKNISPHKLRSTYGTNLYRATRDIYLVADVLGHSDVNITRKHYAQMDDERRKSAVNFIKLKDE